MKIETDRLESIIQALEHMLIDSKYEFRNRWDGSLESPFMNIYRHYTLMTERWRNEENLVLNPYTLESEVKDNFLIANDEQKLNYIKLLNYKLSSLKVEEDQIKELLSTLKTDISNGLVDPHEIIDFSNSEVSSFVYGIEDVLYMVQRVRNIVNENIEIFSPISIKSERNSETIQQFIKFKWKGDKTDLAELVWSLAKSGRINDMSTGQLVTLKELTHQFEILFDVTLDVTGLMKGRMKTYKATSDGNTFTRTLFYLVNERAANS